MATLGRAYIEVHADTKPFNRGLKKQIEEDLADVEKATKASGERSGKNYTDALGGKIHDEIPKIIDDTERLFGNRSVRIKTAVDVDRSSLDRAENAFARTFRTLRSRVSGLVSDINADLATGVARSLGNALANVGQAVTGLGGGLGAVAVVALFAVIAGAVVVLTDAVVALSGALFLLPGAIALVSAAFFILQGVFSSLGDEHATANVRAFAREWGRFGDFLDHLRRVAGRNFFRPLLGSIDEITRALEGPAGAAIAGASESLGRFFEKIAAVFARPHAVELFTDAFRTLGRVFDIIGTPLMLLTDSLIRLADATLPSFEGLARVFAGLIERFRTWINEVTTSGRLSTFIDDAGAFLSMLGEIGFSLVDLLDSIFDASKDDSRELLGLVKKMIDTWTDFFREPEGKAFLRVLLALTLLIVGGINAMIYALAVFIGTIGIAIDATAELLGLYDKVTTRGNIGGAVGKGLQQGVQGHAEGGIFNRPTLGVFGEKGAEAIIPLTDAPRARQIMAESGLMNLAGGEGDVTLIAYIGGEQVDAHIDRRVGAGIHRFASDVSYVSRPGVAY